MMLEEENKSIIAETEHFFRDISSTIDVMSYSPCLIEANKKQEERDILEKVFTEIQENNENIDKLFIGYEDNVLLFTEDFSQEGYKDQVWYSNAIDLARGNYSVNFTSLERGDTTKFILSKPIYYSGKSIGVVGVDCRLDTLYSLLSSKSRYESKEIVLVNEKYHALITPRPKELHLGVIKQHREIFFSDNYTGDHKNKENKYIVKSHKLSESDWYLISLVNKKEINGSILPRLLIISAILIILTLVVSKIYANILGKLIAKPVVEVSSALQSLAKGNLKVSPIQDYPKNEIGVMAKSFNSFLARTELLKADINELKEIKEDLSYSLSLLNASLESTDDGILIINNDGYINKWNHRFLEIWGIKENDISVRMDSKVLPNVEDKIINKDEFLQVIERTFINPDMISFDVIEMTNGKIIERYSFPQEVQGKIVGRVWRYRDITQLKKSEIRLKDSEEKHRVMFTETVDAYCIMENGIFIDVNEAAEKMLNCPHGWLIGKNPMEISPKFQPDGSLSSEKATKRIELALKEGKQTFRWNHLRYDGSEFPAEISLVKIRLKEQDRLLAIWRDITEEQEIAERLKISEENFRLFFETLKDMVFIADLQGHIQYTNNAVVEKLGYDSETLKRMTILDLHDKSEKYQLEDVVNYLINSNDNFCPLPLLNKSGDLIPVETQTWLGKWNGKDSLFAVSKDITKEQEALAKFNKIFDSNPALMALSSYPDRRFIDVNDSFCKSLGYKKEEVIGKTTQDLNLTMEVEKLDLATAKLIAEGNFQNINMKVIPKKGELIEGLFSGELIESNGQKYFLTVMTDITDMRKLDRKLRESEKKYRLLFENMTTGFANHEMIYDENGKPIDYRFLDVNPAFEEFTGLKVDEIVGRTVKEVLPDTEDYWINTYGQVAKTRESLTYENFSAAIDKYFEVKAFSPEADKFAVIFSDSTQRVKALKELEKEKEVAQAATKAKSEFLANMSHEIRTPLNGVIGFTDLLLSTNLTESQKQFAVNANTSGKALLGIISDILDFSKIEAGKMDLDIISASITEILEQAVDIIKFPACKKGLDIILNIPNSFPDKAMVDPLRLKQILVNLLNNAVKFTNQGEIELSAKFTEQEGNSGRFIFSVRDSGIGISQEDSSRLFKAFSQADGSITRRYGGTGLGLVISNYFANQMGSHIDFISEEGAGSEFYFAIDTQYTEGKVSHRNKLRDSKILLADANSHYLERLKNKLEYWGMEVGIVSSMVECQKRIDSETFDVVMLDEGLLQEDNYQDICQAFETNRNLVNCSSIITYCPNDNIDIVEISRKIHAQHIMTKPVLYSDLFNVLAEICSNDNNLKYAQDTSRKIIDTIEPNKLIKILIAEDVDMNMVLIKALIKKLITNVEISEARNGMEAVHIFKQEIPDLVLMDIQMPELDGLEATKAIKKIEKKLGSNVPVIALTAGAFSDDKDKCLQVGMVDFLTKPINVKELTRVLEKFLK
jgi:PAS domain S-box-containing protein